MTPCAGSAAALAGVMIALLTPGSHAQERSVTAGLRLNVHAGAAQLGGDARGVRHGVSAGYGNSRLFSVVMTYDRVPMRDDALAFDLQHIDIGARVYLRGSGTALVPFALASYTWRKVDYGETFFLGDTMDVKVHGGGITLGAGAAYYLSPRLALEASLMRTGGEMDEVVADNLAIRHEDSAVTDSSLRLNVGVSWWIRR